MAPLGVAGDQTPPAWYDENLAALDLTGLAWLYVGGGTGVPVEYQIDGGQAGYWLPGDATKILWQVYRGDSDPMVFLDLTGWTVTARLLDAAGAFVADLVVGTVSATQKSVTISGTGTGARRVMIVEVTARKSGATTDQKSHAVIVVAAS